MPQKDDEVFLEIEEEENLSIKGITDINNEITFEHVRFGYDEKDVLKDLTFTAHKGETVAFIGATGCGKSTVINLVPRFYDATEGEVLVDGVNVKEYTQKALRNKIGYVSQKAILFKGNIKSKLIEKIKKLPEDQVQLLLQVAERIG